MGFVLIRGWRKRIIAVIDMRAAGGAFGEASIVAGGGLLAVPEDQKKVCY